MSLRRYFKPVHFTVLCLFLSHNGKLYHNLTNKLKNHFVVKPCNKIQHFLLQRSWPSCSFLLPDRFYLSGSSVYLSTASSFSADKKQNNFWKCKFCLTDLFEYVKGFCSRPLDKIRTTTVPEVQAQAVINLIRRLLPERANEFAVHVESGLPNENNGYFQVR